MFGKRCSKTYSLVEEIAPAEGRAGCCSRRGEGRVEEEAEEEAESVFFLQSLLTTMDDVTCTVDMDTSLMMLSASFVAW